MQQLETYIAACFYSVTSKKTQYSIAFGAAASYFIIAFITPHLVPLLEPDSISYLDFSPIRTAFYPIFLNIIQAIGFSLNAINIVQLLIFSAALGGLVFHLMLFRLPLLLVLGFYLSMLANIYLTAYHFSILTESLCFSLTLLLVIYLLRFIHYRRTTDLLMMTIVAAIATAIKPAFLAFCVGVLITNFCLRTSKSNWKKRLKATFLVGLLPIICISSLETLIYHQYHDSRESLAPNHLFAKAAMLTLFDGFDKGDIDNEEYRALIDTIEQHLMPTKQYISNIDNFCLRAKTYSEYEVYAQYDLLPQKFADFTKTLGENLPHFQTDFAKNIIMSNLGNYSKLTAIHYLAFFCGGASQKLKNNSVDAPLISNDGTKTGVASQNPLIIYYGFLLLGLAFFIVSAIYSIWLAVLLAKAIGQKVQKQKMSFGELKPTEICAVHLLLWVHGYHLLVALTGLVVTRYLMVSYPMIILALLLTAFAWLARLVDGFNKNKAI